MNLNSEFGLVRARATRCQWTNLTKKASPLAKMDSSFRQVLQEKGVGDHAIMTLLREEICDMETFVMLRESHFAKLNERLSLGQHALLLKIWEGVGMTHGCILIIKFIDV